MNSILWNDTETTGTDPKRCAIIQLAAAVEVDGEVIDTFNETMRPHKGALVDPKALEVSGNTIESVEKFQSPQDVYFKFDKFLDNYGFRKNKAKRFIPGGFNNRFDLDFLQEYFLRNSGGPYAFWEFLQFNPIDPYPVCVMMWRYGLIDVVDCKLGTLCAYFGIEIKAHDALSDLMATRELSKRIVENMDVLLVEMHKKPKKDGENEKALV